MPNTTHPSERLFGTEQQDLLHFQQTGSNGISIFWSISGIRVLLIMVRVRWTS
jgi:hypothetical protein